MAGDRAAAALVRLAAVGVLLLLCSSPAAVVVVSARKVGQTCALDRNCAAGLHCETCVANGNVRPRCTRVVPVDPQTKVLTTSSPVRSLACASAAAAAAMILHSSARV